MLIIGLILISFPAPANASSEERLGNEIDQSLDDRWLLRLEADLEKQVGPLRPDL
jgi:hypothetical protein